MVSLIIPAYNEERRLAPFLTSIASYLPTNPGVISEIIIVDDGSSDNTKNIAESFQSTLPSLRVLAHAKNRGKGAAVQTGVLASTKPIIVFIDADGATPITELPKLLQAVTDADISVGNRWMAGAEAERASFLRWLSGWVYRTYMQLFGLGAVDTMCGFKGYRRDVAIDLFTELTEERWLFDTEVAYKAVRRGYQIKNFPITWTSKDGSKLDTKTLIRSAFGIWPLIQRLERGGLVRPKEIPTQN